MYIILIHLFGYIITLILRFNSDILSTSMKQIFIPFRDIII